MALIGAAPAARANIDKLPPQHGNERVPAYGPAGELQKFQMQFSSPEGEPPGVDLPEEGELELIGLFFS